MTKDYTHTIIIFLLSVLFLFQIVNFYYDRRGDQNHDRVEEAVREVERLQKALSNAQQLNEVMLAGRAVIQTTDVEVNKRLGNYTDEEKRLIGRSWKFTKYNGFLNPFPEYE